MALPKYEQIAADIRGRIVRGELKPGDTVESERELQDRWSVARATVVRALDVLRREDLIETKQGTGSTVKVRIPLARTAGERYDTSVKTGFIYTAGEHADILSAEWVPASEDVASALGVEPGAEVVRRHRVTYEGERPIATSYSYFTAEVAAAAPRLLQRERIRQGTTRYVEMEAGRKPHTGRDVWTARLATEEELRLLQLDGPQAVSETRHIAYDAEGKPLTYEVGINPAGHWARTTEYQMNV
ncbi:GntR family transcriptional regulator [Streptomyces sp. P1-3]|uniref:GntR family transcriptional regulator n=1 Tax=Streptomyces sp. P1-3 TaxID=3421658 RepID=UPI003D361D1B